MPSPAPLLAHQGGWDEWGLPVGAVAVFAGLVAVAVRRGPRGGAGDGDRGRGPDQDRSRPAGDGDRGAGPHR
jgi:hypothetical protein